MQSASSNILYSILGHQKHSLSKHLLLIFSGVLVLAAASQLSIPLKPVPLTFQSTTVVLIGMIYGARYGSQILLAYLIAGALGLPIFANHSGGFIEFIGPTGGYLAGFLPAVFASGYLAQKGWCKNIFSCFAAACIGTSLILLFGVSWLAMLIGWNKAIEFGFLPFVLSEAVKLAVVSALMPQLWKHKPE